MMRYFLIILILFPGTLFAKSNGVFWLNSKSISKEASNNSPAIERIRSALLSSKFNKSEYLENFQPQFKGDASYLESNEIPATSFAPTTSPISVVSLGITKDFTTGISAGAYNIFEKRNFGSFGTNARNGVYLEVTMDLYKDFFGRDSKTRISYFEYEEQIADIQKDIDTEIFLISLNRIYLALILNQEAINVSIDILEIYKNQESDAKKRRRNGIADLSEVKRRSSQVASKRVDIFNLVNKKENLILELKKMLPSISSKEVKLSDYELEKTEKYFSNIAGDIRSKVQTPMDYTKYDEIVSLIEKSYKKQKKFLNHYNDIDLELYSNFNHFGQDSNARGAIDNNYGNAKDSYQVGVRLTAPIGSARSNSKKIQLSLQNANFLARKRENLAKIEAYHTQAIRNLALLKKAKIYQGKNTKDLKQILRLTERKYKQARIPIRDLIEDQNFYLQSLLREIDIKLVIINQIFDYMTIFTNTPFSLSDG